MATAEAEAPEHTPERVGDSDTDEAALTPAQMFKYSTWVHVGPGAEACEAVSERDRKNDCHNPHHFHAWCRLPNPFQHREIREKALAAKARRVRQLRDPESDASAIMEEELDRLARLGDPAKEQIIDELLTKDWWKDMTEAMQNVAEEKAEDAGEDDDPIYARIEKDQERISEIEALPEDERPMDEYNELVAHLDAYNERLESEYESIIGPRKEQMLNSDMNGLVDLIRDDRIEKDSMEQFLHTYSEWSWFVGTLVRPPSGQPRKFKNIESLREADTDVIDTLKRTYNDLEAVNNREGDPLGNE